MMVDAPSQRGIAAQLLGRDVVAVEARPSLSFLSDLYPEELAMVERAIDKRKAEFSTARALARQALAELGVAAQSLCPYKDRSPRWPAGIVGSITHTASFCAVAVARASQVKGIGLDAEMGGALKTTRRSMICCDSELRWIEAHPPAVHGQLAKLVFSAKEAFYKCQYPLTKTFLEFRDVELQFDEANGEFHVQAVRGIDPEIVSACDVQGRYQLSSELVVTATRLDAGGR